MMDVDIFGEIDKSKLRLSKPVGGTPPTYISSQEPISSVNIRRLKPMSSGSNAKKVVR